MDESGVCLANAPDGREVASQVPHQAQQVLISWVFIVASVTLFLDFASLQNLVSTPLFQLPSYFARLNNWFGIVSCICWLIGFAVLLHWLKRVGATPWSMFGAWLKLVASVLFNLQPMTGSAGTAGGAGLWWSNLAGIVLFHVGNLVSCTDMYRNPPPGTCRAKGVLHQGNLPVTGMWTYQFATWFLVLGNFLSCNWPNSSPILKLSDPVVQTCQFAGSSLLLLGSVFYCQWCDGFRSLGLRT